MGLAAGFFVLSLTTSTSTPRDRKYSKRSAGVMASALGGGVGTCMFSSFGAAAYESSTGAALLRRL